MNLLFFSIMDTLLHLTRTCPACKARQVIKPSLKKVTVLCKNCGQKIPPPNK